MAWRSIEKQLGTTPSFPGVQLRERDRKIDNAKTRVVEAARALDKTELANYLVLSKQPKRIKTMHADELKTIVSRMRYLSQETEMPVSEIDLAPFQRELAITRAIGKVAQVERAQSGSPIAKLHYRNLRRIMTSHQLRYDELKTNTIKLKEHAFGSKD